MPGYREDRRIDGIKPLSAVTKNEATESTDVLRERTLELERERIAADRKRADQPKRSFADLIKRTPSK